MEPFGEIVNGRKLLPFFTKSSVLDVWLGFETPLVTVGVNAMGNVCGIIRFYSQMLYLLFLYLLSLHVFIMRARPSFSLTLSVMTVPLSLLWFSFDIASVSNLSSLIVSFSGLSSLPLFFISWCVYSSRIKIVTSISLLAFVFLFVMNSLCCRCVLTLLRFWHH